MLSTQEILNRLYDENKLQSVQQILNAVYEAGHFEPQPETNIIQAEAGMLQDAINEAVDKGASVSNPYNVVFDESKVLVRSNLVVPDGVNLVPLHPERWVQRARSPRRHKIGMARKALITLTFDDGYPSEAANSSNQTQALNVTSYEYLRRLGIGPTFALQPDNQSRLDSGRGDLAVMANNLWALGGDLSSHCYHAHEAAFDPYRAENDTDEKIVADIDLELRTARKALEVWSAVPASGGAATPVTGECRSYVAVGSGFTGDAYLNTFSDSWRSKLNGHFAKVIANEYEFCRVYGQGIRAIGSDGDYWQGYLEATAYSFADITAAIDRAIAEKSVLDLMSHGWNQALADVVDYVVAKRDAGLCEIVSYNKARYVEFVGTTASAFVAGGQFEEFAEGALTHNTWYKMATGDVATGARTGLMAMRPYRWVGDAATMVMDIVADGGQNWIRLAAGGATDKAQIQLNNSDVATGQNTIRFKVKVPAGKTARFNFEYQVYSYDTAKTLANKINNVADDIVLTEGTHTITRSMICRPTDNRIQVKLLMIPAANNTLMVSDIEWF